jgi:hypothetical protein
VGFVVDKAALGQVFSVGFVVDKTALRQVFSEYFGFPCLSSFTNFSIHPGLAY